MNRICELKVRIGRRRLDQAKLDDVLEQSRLLYNGALQERREAFKKLGKSPSFFDQCKSLTIIRAEHPEYAALGVDMVRMTVFDRLKKAYANFFRRVAENKKLPKAKRKKVGYPRFKSYGRFDTLIFNDRGWKLDGRKLHIKGIGWLLVTKLPHREGKPIGLRLVKKASGWHAQIVLDVGAPRVVATVPEKFAGIDVGLLKFATVSDGKNDAEVIEHPKFLKAGLGELATAQRALSTKKDKRSNRRKKAVKRVARVHAGIANRRRNFLRQAVAWLLKNYDGFAVEDLRVKQMAHGNLARSIMDSAWRTFVNMLAAKAEEAGLPVVKVDPRGTTQRCSRIGCSVIVKKLLFDRVHDCPVCGLVMDRDENAAINIRDLGWRSAGKPAETAA